MVTKLCGWSACTTFKMLRTFLALEPKPMKPVSGFTWAHYFGITFIAALALGLLVPILFLVGIIVVCRRRHQNRHSIYGTSNSKLFSTNLWHYIGGKEVSEEPFAEHAASMHRPPFKFPQSDMGTLAMHNGDMMDLPDVVIPGGRVVAMGGSGYSGTLGPNGTMRPQYNGYTYGASTMMTGKQQMMGGQPGMMNCYMGPNMMNSQPNFNTDYSGQAMMSHASSVGECDILSRESNLISFMNYCSFSLFYIAPWAIFLVFQSFFAMIPTFIRRINHSC